MKKSIVIAISVIVAATAVAAGVFFYRDAQIKAEMKALLSSTDIYSGISINGIDVGLLSSEEAYTKLKTELDESFDDKFIEFHYGDETWSYNFKDFGVKNDIESAVKEAFEYGRDGEDAERYKKIKALEVTPVDIECKYTYDKTKVNEKINEVAAAVFVEAKDSTMSRENGTFVITDEQTGFEMDINAASENVITIIESMESGSVEITGTVTEPKVTREENEKATSLIGSYYTTFSPGSWGRDENLRVGCANINGTVLQPGEEFSMNEGLGPQTYENGYRNATVIVNGKYEDGLAGGVCQITTTLYNAAILAELNITQRSNHSLAVGYIPLGQDAAVAGTYKDLKFVNNTDYPIYIEAYTTSNKVVCNIYGHEEHDSTRKIEFENIVTATIPKPAEKVTEDPELPEGTREVTSYGKEGKKVATYKLVYENGTLLSREFFSNSTYIATADEVTVGTKKAEDAMSETNASSSAGNNSSTENSQENGSIFQ